MELTREGIKNQEAWQEKGYELPAYDIEKMAEQTKKHPYWIHFGAGNLFRAFHAEIAQKLLNAGITERGVIVAEGFDQELIGKVYASHDNLAISAVLKADGTIRKEVIAGIAEALPLDAGKKETFERLKTVFSEESLQMATFTITEKGYALRDGNGELLPDVARDFQAGPDAPESYMGKVTALLYARYRSGKKPIAMVSTDNCSHNGEKLHDAVVAFADAWGRNHRAEPEFLSYIDSKLVSFPWSMIDKITPRPDETVRQLLEADGVCGLDTVVTAKHTYAAPFVNSEETGYLVIEDDFPNGRIPLEAGGILLTDRKTVDQVEKMKVCTCLNPLHTGLAVFGCLLGFNTISDEMTDPDLSRFARILGEKEGLPVVTDPKILDPREFLETVLTVRLPNPFLPDTPQRIATDTSQKLAIRFGETIRAYDAGKRNRLRMIPLVFAGWLRYLMETDDHGEGITLSPDPLLQELCPVMETLSHGDSFQKKKETIVPILKRADIFGMDLMEAGLGEMVCKMFDEMTMAPGAVRTVLTKYVEG